MLAFAAIDGASRLRSLSKPMAVAFAVCCVALSALVVRPLSGLTGYMSASRAAASDACLDTIPRNAPVAASDRLIPHLTHRLHIRRLVKQEGEPYLAIAGDGHPGDMRVLAAVRSGEAVPRGEERYRLVCRNGDVTVFAAA